MNKVKLWGMASRPKTLVASLVPILVGTTLALSFIGSVNWMLAAAALMTSVCIQIATNLINDALDFKKGADTEKRIGPQRVTQSGLVPMTTVLNAGFFFLGLAFLFGLYLVFQVGWSLLPVLVASITLAYLYTGGPYPLAYRGLGDLFVFLFFGLVSTSIAYYIQVKSLDTQALLAGTQVGLLATVLIAINNLRDIEGDTAAQKKTLAVRFGVLFSRIEITFLVFAPYLLGFFWYDLGYDFAAWLPIITLPFGGRIVRSIWLIDPSRQYNQFLAYSALLQLLFGMVLCVSFLAKT